MSLSTLRAIDEVSTRENKTNLYVKRSPMRNAGNGLFSFNRIKRGKIICEYIGRFITQRDIDNGTERKDYCAGNGYGVIVNALNEDGEIVCAAGYINDALDEDKYNCKFHWVQNRCYIKATRDISDHEEILIHYGHEYWFSTEWDSTTLCFARAAYAESQAEYAMWSDVIITVADMEEAITRGAAAGAAAGPDVLIDHPQEVIDLTTIDDDDDDDEAEPEPQQGRCTGKRKYGSYRMFASNY